MGMPKVPDITPKIKLKRREAVNLLLTSIALEELGLAHILNAEGEKIQEVIKCKPSLDDLLKVNKSVERTLRGVIKQEMLLQFKLEDTLDLICDEKDCDDDHDHGHDDDHCEE